MVNIFYKYKSFNRKRYLLNLLNSDLEVKRVIRYDAGYTVPNVINITGTVICKLPNRRRVVYCQINGSQLEAGKSATDYKWLNGQIILHSLANEFGCSSFYVNEGIIPINQSGILTGSNIGYGPAVQFWAIDGNMFFCLGRYYTRGYDFGLWQMSVMNAGLYSFSFITQIW